MALFPLTEMNAQINHKHYVLMGKIDLSKENYSDAIKNFNIAIIAKPNDFEAYFLRGIAKYSLSDYTGAVDDFSRTLEEHPLYVRAYHYRGVANDRLSNYADAMADFRRAISLDPFSEDLHLAQGSTLMTESMDVLPPAGVFHSPALNHGLCNGPAGEVIPLLL